MKKIGQYTTSVAVIILIAGNLRAPITSVSPVLGEISAALRLNSFQGSLLTSIPLMVFAMGSMLVGSLASKLGVRYSLLLSTSVLCLGLYLRVYGTMPMLYLGSFFMGIGICIGNVLVPAYIKKVFPQKIGIMTGVFTVGMNVLAALASGFSIAIGRATEMGWQGSLGVWIISGVLAFLVISADALLNKVETPHAIAKAADGKFNVFRSKQAWYISIFMGLQSLVYYCLVALLPTVLTEYGMAKDGAGTILLIIQMAMMPVLFICPVLAMKLKDQKNVVYGIGSFMFAGIALLLFFKLKYIYLAAILIGMASGSAFSLAILFFSLKSSTGHGLVKISGKAQSVGYLIAAFGPPIFGWLHDRFDSWESSFYFILFMILVMTVFGIRAAKPRFIEEH